MTQLTLRYYLASTRFKRKEALSLLSEVFSVDGRGDGMGGTGKRPGEEAYLFQGNGLERSGGTRPPLSEDEIGYRGERALRGFNDWSWVDREIERAEELGVRIITLLDDEYPQLLRQIPDRPLLLYGKGEFPPPTTPTIGIVGTRRATRYGLKHSERFGHDLTAMGVSVVSGLARGCDTSAHRGALKALSGGSGNKGPGGGAGTIAVLGTGIDQYYPGENKALQDEIMEGGGIVLSEYPLGSTPLPRNFPRRNRIISGLSLGVLVIEAPERSGALQTARLSLDYNRGVMAIPGELSSARSEGSNRLIQEGAALVSTAEDVVREMAREVFEISEIGGVRNTGTGSGSSRGVGGSDRTSAERGLHITAGGEPLVDEVLEVDIRGGEGGSEVPLEGVAVSSNHCSTTGGSTTMGSTTGDSRFDGPPEEVAILELLDDGPLQIDVLTSMVGLPPQRVSALLVALELKGKLEALPGKVFTIK